MKRCPSNFSPTQGRKRLPGTTLRLSVHTAVTGAAPSRGFFHTPRTADAIS